VNAISITKREDTSNAIGENEWELRVNGVRKMTKAE
jgi:hypothetical protein